jgi:hypothetical protein
MNNDIEIFKARFSLPAFAAVTSAFAALYYATLTTGGRFDFFQPYPLGTTFNSMLEHLLRGEFNVDPSVIRLEGFVHDGKTYSYFGIFPALLRLPLIPLHRLATTDMTVLSCVVASSFAAYCEIQAAIAVYRTIQAGLAARALFLAIVISAMLGGPQLQFLVPSIFQEVVAWAGAIAAAFVNCAVRGLVIDRAFSTGRLIAMSMLAGVELLTRVSTAVGLYAAMGLLLVSLAWSLSGAPESPRLLGAWPRFIRFTGSLLHARILGPGAILLGFAALVGIVNYERWGNPLVFADFHLQLMVLVNHPDRLVRLDQYGEFNIQRLGYGLMYYFLPLWAIIGPNGKFLFSEFQQRFIDTPELPPSSFFLTDPLFLVLAAVFFARIRSIGRSGIVTLRHSAPLLAGLAMPGFLMLIASYMAFRYRMEFYPFLYFTALLGFLTLSKLPPRLSDRNRVVFVRAITAFGVISSHILLLFYWISPLGPLAAPDVGWLKFYYWEFVKTFGS